jgi:hypothetical protein
MSAHEEKMSVLFVCMGSMSADPLQTTAACLFAGFR